MKLCIERAVIFFEYPVLLACCNPYTLLHCKRNDGFLNQYNYIHSKKRCLF